MMSTSCFEAIIESETDQHDSLNITGNPELVSCSRCKALMSARNVSLSAAERKELRVLVNNKLDKGGLSTEAVGLYYDLLDKLEEW
jgi:hypothetical protein